nr:hypothetical protein [Tanacetum cinerariifolium]
MGVLLAKERILKLIQDWDEKQIQSWSLPELLLQLSNNSRTIDEILKQRKEKRVEREQAANLAVLSKFTNSSSWDRPMIDDDEENSIQYRLYLENSSNAITTVLPTKEPEYSLSMGDEHLSTILETESDELIKSSVENLVPIPSEYEVTSDNERELISAVMNNIDELIEDECFDLGGEIDVFENVKDEDYFPFIFVIRIFLPYLIYPEVSPILFSTGSEDIIFDPSIST